jgi:hypothetical protein
MGKTHRIGITSRSYRFKKRKAQTHSIIRTHNRNCDDENINTFNCKTKRPIYIQSPFFYCPLFPISNCREFYYYDDKTLNLNFNYKWNSIETSLYDTINTIYNTLPIEPPTSSCFTYWSKQELTFLTALQKQIQRRKKPGRFYGYRSKKNIFF